MHPDAETMKTVSKLNNHLANLLETFNATWLGEGDTNAGTNLLVAMAATLANVARPGSGIVASKCLTLRAGANLIVSGGLSSGLVSDRVLRELLFRQNNVIAQLRRLLEDKIADSQREGVRSVKFPSGARDNASQNALYGLEEKESLVCANRLDSWEEVMLTPPNPRIEHLAARPKVLVTATGPKDLSRQLKDLHGNRALVALSLKRVTDASGLADTCVALLDDSLANAEGTGTVLGNLLITDPCNSLPTAIPRAGAEPGCLERMVWLLDSDHGPDAEEAGANKAGVQYGNMRGRFETALLRALAKRFNNHDAREVAHEFDLGAAQFRWVNYLKQMEPRLPGIIASARGLLGTLAFGLIELAKAPKLKSLSVDPQGVEALGCWVVERMANARAEMLHTAELEWRMEMARKIFFIVSQGPRSARDIYRALSLPAEPCQQLLRFLESQQLLSREEKEWRSVEGAVFTDSIRSSMALGA